MTQTQSNEMSQAEQTEHIQAEVLQEKCRTISSIPGVEVEFDPHEAEHAGAFQEEALSEEDAREAAFDQKPLG